MLWLTQICDTQINHQSHLSSPNKEKEKKTNDSQILQTRITQQINLVMIHKSI